MKEDDLHVVRAIRASQAQACSHQTAIGAADLLVGAHQFASWREERQSDEERSPQRERPMGIGTPRPGIWARAMASLAGVAPALFELFSRS